jgi:uncharacterized protein YjeT (DUF2065 family)
MALEAPPGFNMAATGPRLHAGDSRTAPARRRAYNPLWAMVLAIILAGLLVFVAPLAWKAMTNALSAGGKPTLEHCAMIAENEPRLACYDRVAAQQRTQPARGAFAPPLFHPGERSER